MRRRAQEYGHPRAGRDRGDGAGYGGAVRAIGAAATGAAACAAGGQLAQGTSGGLGERAAGLARGGDQGLATVVLRGVAREDSVESIKDRLLGLLGSGCAREWIDVHRAGGLNTGAVHITFPSEADA